MILCGFLHPPFSIYLVMNDEGALISTLLHWNPFFGGGLLIVHDGARVEKNSFLFRGQESRVNANQLE